MSFENLASKLWSENILFTVLLELTYSCNLDCFFCYNDRELPGKPLSKEQYFSLLQELQEMQVLNVVLSGGEPLAHPDFFAIGNKARELGFVVRIKSNGHALHREMVERIKHEIDPFTIDISLHGATAKTHDRQTQVKGSFDRLMKNFRILQEMGMRFRLNGTLTAWNSHEIEAMYAIAEKFGIALNLTPSVTARDNGDIEPLSIAPTESAINEALELLATKREAMNPPSSNGSSDEVLEPECAEPQNKTKQCGTGSSTLTIDPVGNILPCVQWRRQIGNLHETNIKAIWTNSRDLDDIRNTAIEAKHYVENHAPDPKQKGFYCIAEALAQTGSQNPIYSVPLSELQSK